MKMPRNEASTRQGNPKKVAIFTLLKECGLPNDTGGHYRLVPICCLLRPVAWTILLVYAE